MKKYMLTITTPLENSDCYYYNTVEAAREAFDEVKSGLSRIQAIELEIREIAEDESQKVIEYHIQHSDAFGIEALNEYEAKQMLWEE